MRTFGITILVAALPGLAAAQPGGSDLPLGPAMQPDGSAGAPIEPVPPEAQPMPEQQGPQLPDPASAPTRATFVSTTERQWDVWVDRYAVCSTPCSLPLASVNYVALRTQERNPIRLDVGYLPQGDLMITGKPLQNGLYSGGIIMTTFAGMSLATGITLTAVGLATDRGGMALAGYITGGAGAIGLYAGIYMMRKALPSVSIGPAQPYVGANQVGFTGNF